MRRLALHWWTVIPQDEYSAKRRITGSFIAFSLSAHYHYL